MPLLEAPQYRELAGLLLSALRLGGLLFVFFFVALMTAHLLKTALDSKRLSGDFVTKAHCFTPAVTRALKIAAVGSFAIVTFALMGQVH